MSIISKLRLLLLLALAGTAGVTLAEPRLGEPPTAPTDVSHLPRRVTKNLVSGGFTVDTASREQTRAFFNSVFKASDGVPMNSSAVVKNCLPGTNSADFQDAVVRRINWYRAMAGLPATITLDPANSAKNQQGALMMSRNDTLSHTPPNTWFCWTQDGADAAGNSNIGIGSTGPDSVTSYVRDAGAGNAAAGHRRWILYPPTQIMGTGNVPDQGAYLRANTLWVFDGHYSDPRPATRTGFVAWPPAGFVPVKGVFPRWSIAHPGADFGSATVSMLSNGIPVSVAQEPLANGYGENTLVWVPMGLNATSYYTTWPFNGKDTVYTLSIANVDLPSGPTNFNYTVTVFDPEQPGADAAPPVVSGPAGPVVGVSNLYTFTMVTNATSHQWRYIRRMPYSLNDGAEGGLVNFTEEVGGYAVINNNPVASGTHAFQLAHDYPEPQLLTLNPLLGILTNTVMTFKSQLKIARADQVARVQMSTNEMDWFDLYAQAGAGSPGETSWKLRTLALGAYAGSSARIRFNYDFDYGNYYSQVGSTYGWHFDEILITNLVSTLPPVMETAAAAQFQFKPPQAGEYGLQVRGVMFTDFPLDWGPEKLVTATNGPPVIRAESISVVGGTTTIPFGVESGPLATFKLLQAATLSGPWTTNTAATLTVVVPGAAYKFSVAAPAARMFYRVKAP